MALVIYSARTGRIRRYIFDEVLGDSTLLSKFPPLVGEAHAMFATIPGTLGELQSQLTARTGLTPTNDRYVLVRANGEITGAILADPATGDSIPGRTLVAHPDAEIGWRQMRDGSFQRAIADINREIANKNREIAMVNGATWSARMARNGQTPAQITAERARIIADANAAITVLETERTARQAPR